MFKKSALTMAFSLVSIVFSSTTVSYYVATQKGKLSANTEFIEVEGEAVYTDLYGEFEIHPGESKINEVKFVCVLEALYTVSITFNEVEQSDLKEFLNLEVQSVEDNFYYTGNLGETIDDKKVLSFTTYLRNNDTKHLFVNYHMPSDVGNEAQNKIANFTFTIKIAVQI